MLEELKSLNENKSDLLWLIKVRSLDYLEKLELEYQVLNQDRPRAKRIASKYCTINDDQLNQLLVAVTFRIDQLTSKISLKELAGLI